MNKQFDLTNRWDPDKYYYTSQRGPGSNDNKRVLHIFQTSETGSQLLAHSNSIDRK